MNYYFNTQGAQIFWLQYFVLIFLLFACVLINVFIIKKLHVSDLVSNALLISGILLIFVFVFGGARLLRDRYDYGKIAQLYLIETQAGPRLVVQFSRTEQMRFGTFHTPRLASYDLYSGRQLGDIWPSHRKHADNYRIFGPFGQLAWGYCYADGVRLLDLAKPEVLAGRQEILAKNPQLGGSYKFISSDYMYDPSNQTIQVMTNNGRYFQINQDLQARQVPKYSRQTSGHYPARLRLNTDLVRGKEKWLFRSKDGYTLTAIRQDRASGRVLDKIKYFD